MLHTLTLGNQTNYLRSSIIENSSLLFPFSLLKVALPFVILLSYACYNNMIGWEWSKNVSYFSIINILWNFQLTWWVSNLSLGHSISQLVLDSFSSSLTIRHSLILYHSFFSLSFLLLSTHFQSFTILYRRVVLRASYFICFFLLRFFGYTITWE